MGGEGRGQGEEERGWGHKSHLSWSVWLCCEADQRENWPGGHKVTTSSLKKEGREEINSMLPARNLEVMCFGSKTHQESRDCFEVSI